MCTCMWYTAFVATDKCGVIHQDKGSCVFKKNKMWFFTSNFDIIFLIYVQYTWEVEYHNGVKFHSIIEEINHTLLLWKIFNVFTDLFSVVTNYTMSQNINTVFFLHQ